MSSRPLAVLLTVYNGQPYLESAIQSVLGQTYSDFDFLIVDNASTDDSRDVVAGMSDPRIRLVCLPENLGHTGALQHGLESLESKYVARMDADDLCSPVRFERQMAYLTEHPDTALVGTWYEGIDAHGAHVGKFELPTQHEDILEQMLYENQFVHSSVIYDREIILAKGGYDTRLRRAQDFHLWWRVALDHRVANIPEFLVQIRYHANQLTYEGHTEMAEEVRKLINSILDDSRLPESLRKLRGRAQGYADLRYAAVVAAAGEYGQSYRSAVHGLLRSPGLVTSRSARSYASRALLGRRCFEAIRSLKNQLSNQP